MTNELLEKLAKSEHDRWSRWMFYLFSESTLNEDGTVTIPEKLVARWKGQAGTCYHRLSDAEKESDRKEARRTLAIIGTYFLGKEGL